MFGFFQQSVPLKWCAAIEAMGSWAAGVVVRGGKGSTTLSVSTSNRGENSLSERQEIPQLFLRWLVFCFSFYSHQRPKGFDLFSLLPRWMQRSGLRSVVKTLGGGGRSIFSYKK